MERNGDLISRQTAIDALWKAMYEYEDKTEKQFQESEDLDVEDWIVHRIFVQNMNDIDRQTILNLPSAQPDLNEWCTDCKEYDKEKHCCPRFNRVIREALKDAEAKQYTKEELKIFLHGLSLRLLSLRSAQHWQEDEEIAKEIVFLAHLYEKVEADMKGKT